jgi:orotate phosphoribosyltransferase-like protein
MKKELREKAILLRKQGFSYREIMNQIPVAKSTTSEWLQEVGTISARELWLIGTMLYWAEGSKQKERSIFLLAKDNLR